MIISNTSPLIYLSKIGKLEILKRLFSKVIIPKQVYDEIMKGKKENYVDAFSIEHAINYKWIVVKDIVIKNTIFEIHEGELAVIELAKKLKPEMVLLDDRTARTISEGLGFNTKGTLYVLLKAFKKKFISKKELIDLINQLVYSGFRISQEVYIRVLKEIERLK